MATDPIGAELRRLRKQRGWSLATASAHANLPTVVLGSWERGVHANPSWSAWWSY